MMAACSGGSFETAGEWTCSKLIAVLSLLAGHGECSTYRVAQLALRLC